MKNVLITGACGGMGRAAAEYLKEQGYNVFGIDMPNECPLDIEYISVDVTNTEAIEAAYEIVKSKADTLDGIIHFAGLYNMSSLIEMSERDFTKIFNVNVFGIYRINKAFFPLLKEGSRIVITSSELAPLDPLPFTGIYGITKSTVEKYAYSLRMELNLKGIKVSVIRPGAIKTDMLSASNVALERLRDSTQLYQKNISRFQQVIDSVETRNVPAKEIAKLAHKALTAKNPKYVYNINRNPLLKLLNILPQRLQVAVIGMILKEKN